MHIHEKLIVIIRYHEVYNKFNLTEDLIILFILQDVLRFCLVFDKYFLSNREEFEEEIDNLRVKNAEKDVHMKQIELKLHEEEEGVSFFPSLKYFKVQF